MTKKKRLRKKVSISLPAQVLDRIDSRATAENRSRSQWISLALAAATAEPVTTPIAVDGAA